MVIVGRVEFREVLDRYSAARRSGRRSIGAALSGQGGFRRWAAAFQHDRFGMKNLVRANRSAEDWVRARLECQEALGIVLPWHKDGDIELIPPTGCTLGEALTTLAELEKAYRDASPHCWKTIEALEKSYPSPIFLSTSPIGRRDYARVPRTTGLIHLDGLHRLLAWGRSGRLDGVEIEAYVARIRRRAGSNLSV